MTRATRPVTFRDFLIFQLKLVLDGVKDVAVFNVSIAAMGLDILSGAGRRPRLLLFRAPHLRALRPLAQPARSDAGARRHRRRALRCELRGQRYAPGTPRADRARRRRAATEAARGVGRPRHPHERTGADVEPPLYPPQVGVSGAKRIPTWWVNGLAELAGVSRYSWRGSDGGSFRRPETRSLRRSEPGQVPRDSLNPAHRVPLADSLGKDTGNGDSAKGGSPGALRPRAGRGLSLDAWPP